MTRGEANNNPFDLRYSPKIPWMGLDVPPQDDKGYCRFARYADARNPMFWGLRAGFRDLWTKWSIDGLNTIDQIVPKFAPASENDTEAYIRLVCERTGWPRDATLDLGRPGALKLFGKAFLLEEQGAACAFSDAQLDQAVAAAAPPR